jgi:hypothetical protein
MMRVVAHALDYDALGADSFIIDQVLGCVHGLVTDVARRVAGVGDVVVHAGEADGVGRYAFCIGQHGA